jgi:hypothetical protein
MNNYFRVVAGIILLQLVSCLPEPVNKSQTYQNIIILSDLSDRVEPLINGIFPNQQYPPKDEEEIKNILRFFKDECVKPGEKIGDKSSILFSTFSTESVASIDIDKIKDLGSKQQFINSTGKYENNGLNQAIEEFNKKVQNAYRNIRNPGLDLLSVMVDKVENGKLIKENKVLTNGVDTTFINFDNHIYIFTDGYLEYKGKNSNSQFYFGINEIEQIRKYCTAQNVDIKTALDKNRSFCLPRIENNIYQFVNLHVLETHERDKDVQLQKYINPRGLRDNEILREVWRKWAVESGFKSFEWRKY